MSKKLEKWTCPECDEEYLINMTTNDILEKASRAQRCGTCGHILWRWEDLP
jgi:predicted RNA-binding Zn-ribbon protein involved in translation (DUF1610 family)